MKKIYKSLSEVSEIIMGQSPSSNSYNTTRNGLPFFQGKSEFGEFYPTPVKWCTAPTKIAEAGDILISVRAPVGPTNLANEKCCIGRGLAAIRAIPQIINRDFLWLQIRHLESFIAEKGQGSTFEAIGGDDLRQLQIYTPDLETQIQISSRLKEQLAQVQKARIAAEVKLNDINLLPQKLLKDAFDF